MASDAELLEALVIATTGHDGQGLESPVDRWPDFLHALARTILADGLALMLQPQEGPRKVWTCAAGANLPDRKDMTKMRTGRVYSQIDLPGVDPAKAPLRALRCALPGGGNMVLVAQRLGADFRAVDAARLSALGPMMARSLAGWQALYRERASAGRDRQALAAMSVGWLVLSTTGQVLAAAPGLAADLAPQAGLRLRADGWVDFADTALAASIRAAQVEAQSGVCVTPVSLPTLDPMVRLCVQATEHMGAPALILWLRRQPSARDLPGRFLAQGLRLTNSEARLAACIADGQSLAEAAADLGWTVETTRGVSKALYAQLRVRGQTGVALALQSSPLWLAETAVPATKKHNRSR